MHCFSTITGRLHGDFQLTALAGQLAAAGLRVEMKKRLCPTRNDYIRIHEGDDFTLQADILRHTRSMRCRLQSKRCTPRRLECPPS